MGLSGAILINKPLGKTSHDMVYFVRRLFGIKRVGHTGTLDPQADGVLPVLIGPATKASDYMMNSDKEYLAKVQLGITTDTQDASGQITSTCPVQVTEQAILDVATQFVGEIDQVPPMYSALKVDGQKLYSLARKGMEVERKARKVTVFAIEIYEIDLCKNTFWMKVSCSKGTYIRTLAGDIGDNLGCGAHILSLRRTKSAGFTLEQTYTLDQLTALKEAGKLENVIIPTSDLFRSARKMIVSQGEARKIKNGIPLSADDFSEGDQVRLFGPTGEFLCISAYHEGRLKMERSFWQEEG
jgi:tRNA pseudouridine55 synthase